MNRLYHLTGTLTRQETVEGKRVKVEYHDNIYVIAESAYKALLVAGEFAWDLLYVGVQEIGESWK